VIEVRGGTTVDGVSRGLFCKGSGNRPWELGRTRLGSNFGFRKVGGDWVAVSDRKGDAQGIAVAALNGAHHYSLQEQAFPGVLDFYVVGLVAAAAGASEVGGRA